MKNYDYMFEQKPIVTQEELCKKCLCKCCTYKEKENGNTRISKRGTN